MIEAIDLGKALYPGYRRFRINEDVYKMIADLPSRDFKLPNFRDVDESASPSACIDFLDWFVEEHREMIEIGIDLLDLHPGSVVLDAGCGHGTAIPVLASRVGASGRGCWHPIHHSARG